MSNPWQNYIFYCQGGEDFFHAFIWWLSIGALNFWFFTLKYNCKKWCKSSKIEWYWNKLYGNMHTIQEDPSQRTRGKVLRRERTIRKRCYRGWRGPCTIYKYCYSGGINYTRVNFSENEGNSVTEGGEGWRRVERTPYYLEIFLQWRKIEEIVKIGK